MKQNTAVTIHARERIIQRVGSKKRALHLLRTAPISWREEDGAVIYKNGGFRFVVQEAPKCWTLVTVLTDESSN